MASQSEFERRCSNVRSRMDANDLDALLICSNEYAGFEGAVRYLSGFEIVHRYAFVLLPLGDEPTLIIPSEARWIGNKKEPWLRRHEFPDVPGSWVRRHCEGKGYKRIGVYGMDFAMPVRDYRELAQADFELVPFDFEFDMARAVKSDEELDQVRDSMDLIEEGFWAMLRSYQPGKTEAQIMAPAIERFYAGGAGTRMLNLVLSGSGGEAEPHVESPGRRIARARDLLICSLEITAAEGYWVEFSRPLIDGPLSPRTEKMAEIYPHALEAARLQMRDGATASSVHHAAAGLFAQAGYKLGHLSGHSIGLTMIEHPLLGDGFDTELRENMILSFHPHVLDPSGECCLYTQDTFRVGRTEGENLSKIPWRIFTREEAAAMPQGAAV